MLDHNAQGRRGSPHTRGSSHALGRAHRGQAGSPAHAGIVPWARGVLCESSGFPRRRGDRPAQSLIATMDDEVLPQTQGSSLSRRHGGRKSWSKGVEGVVTEHARVILTVNRHALPRAILARFVVVDRVRVLAWN